MSDVATDRSADSGVGLGPKILSQKIQKNFESGVDT
jgi:hypothetical protein